MNKKLLKTILLTTLPVMAGYIVLGIGFGILLRLNGYGFFWALAMSLFVYAGSMQYVGVSLLSAGASLLSIALTTLMVNARHLFYGISMIDRYKGAGRKKPYLIHALTDETYSIVCTRTPPDNADPHLFYLLVSIFNHTYWIAGSLAGSLIGSLIPFQTNGIDFAMTALFVTIFVEQWISTKEHRPAMIGLAVSVICLLCFGPSNFLIPSLLIITALLCVFRRYFREGGSTNAD